MKSTEELIDFIEKELKILALEDLNIRDNDAPHEVRYKNTQIGKHIAFEKMLAFAKNTHNTQYPPRQRAKKEEARNVRKQRPIIVCNK